MLGTLRYATLLCALAAPLAAGAIDIQGTSAGLSWTAATGPVAGYAVQVSRNGGGYAEVARVSGTSTRVSGNIGDTLAVRVAAYDVTGRMGNVSPASDSIRFVEAPAPAPAPPPAPAPAPPPPPPGGEAEGDVDGDGASDALAFNAATGQLSALLIRPDGSRSWQEIGAPAESGMRPVGYADVDGDGQGDVLWRDAGSGANELWLMSGTRYSPISLPSEPGASRVVAFRDFSGDGRADALFHDPGNGASVLWTLTSSGRSGVFTLDAAPSGMSLTAVADLDGDSSPDLVWMDPTTRALEAWQMSGANPVAVHSLPSAPPGSGTLATVGDFDGDASEDLAWTVARKGKRSIHVWFMDGMNEPDRGVALRLNKKALLRGAVDVTNDGRADLVLVRKSGFTAYRVDHSGASKKGEMTWNARAVELSEVPTSKRWHFLVLE